MSTAALPPRLPPNPSHRDAFTLVELLAAMAVLALMLAMILQITGNTLQATRISRQEMDASQQSRTVLDALEADLSNRVTQADLTALAAEDTSHNSQLVFLTNGRSPNVAGQAPARFVAVNYQLTGTTLQRRTATVAWTTTQSMVDAALAATAKTATITNLANGILRFEAVAVLDDGTISPLSQAGNWQTSTVNAETIPTPFFGLVLETSALTDRRVRSLVVGVATLDGQTLNLPGAQNIVALLTAPAAGQTPYGVWSQVVATPGGLASAPAPARAALRIEQRSYALD